MGLFGQLKRAISKSSGRSKKSKRTPSETDAASSINPSIFERDYTPSDAPESNPVGDIAASRQNTPDGMVEIEEGRIRFRAATLIDIPEATHAEAPIPATNGLLVPPSGTSLDNEVFQDSAFKKLAEDDYIWPQVDSSPNSPEPSGAGSRILSLKSTEGVIRSFAATEDYRVKLLALRGEYASNMLESIQTWLDKVPSDHSLRRPAIYALVKLSRDSGLFPPSLSIDSERDLRYYSKSDPVNIDGGQADIFCAIYRGSVTVAVKRPRIRPTIAYPTNKGSSNPPLIPRYDRNVFCREALVWRQLKHDNLVPFMGLDEKAWTVAPGIVSEWMTNGTVRSYVHGNIYEPDQHRPRLLTGIAEGLKYLHSLRIVHGDINDRNVLLDGDFRPRLVDFGLILVGHGTSGGFTRGQNGYGTEYWMAPERLDLDEEKDCRTEEADVYAYGCLCYAVCCGLPPFGNQRTRESTNKIIAGQRPDRPGANDCIKAAVPSNDLWALITRCWDHTPSLRPTSAQIVELQVDM